MGSLGERVVQAMRERVVIAVSDVPGADYDATVFSQAVLVTVPYRMLVDEDQSTRVLTNLIKVGVEMLPEHRPFVFSHMADDSYKTPERLQKIGRDLARALEDDDSREMLLHYCSREITLTMKGIVSLQKSINRLGEVMLPVLSWQDYTPITWDPIVQSDSIH